VAPSGDSIAFEADLDLARKLDQEGRPADALQHLESAIDRYRGDYFSDSAHSEWAQFDRMRMRTRFLAAAHRAASLRLGKGEFQAALRHVGQALSVDDLDEPSYRLQGLIYYRSGDRNAARRALRQGIDRLEADQFSPGEDLLRLYRKLSPDEADSTRAK
jgi:DNA-binding SARP family transcriptional activator